MLSGVADTHAVIWYVFGDKRLSTTARAFMDAAASNSQQIGLSAITFAEIVYLVEKGRVPADTLNQLLVLLDTPGSAFSEIPFNRRIAEALPRVDRLKVPDLPDRIITATALELGVPLISRDARIQVSGIATIW
jgi:PIN domain nuclease of toxin-antitoxin system